MIYDALVIGGGPAGGTSALLLARAGWSVAVVEKAEFPRRKVCGEFISATTLPLLDELGLADAFLKSAGPAGAPRWFLCRERRAFRAHARDRRREGALGARARARAPRL